MPPTLATQKKKRNRSGENFKKRWQTFIKRGDEIHEYFSADVYILLRYRGRIYEFKSSGKAWPLPSEDIVIRRALIVGLIVANLQRQHKTFPIPVQVTVEDLAHQREEKLGK